MRARAFTLIELLVVIAIIAILVAIFAPVFVAAKNAVKQSVAVSAGRQLYMSTELYMADHNDTFPVSMYTLPGGWWQTWYGLQTGPTEWDVKAGILGPYRGDKVARDPSHMPRPYLGDLSGFGYNYGYIGGDFHITGDFSYFPNCVRPATSGELASVSTTVIFASSAYYSAPWTGGDGEFYDFGFIDPPEAWNGNPNVDFRHFGKRRAVQEGDEEESEGRAVIVFADGRVKPHKKKQLEAAWFRRAQNPN